MEPNTEERMEWTAPEWFTAANRWYVEGHQGCASCHGQHCVFRSEWGLRVEYYCSECDFSACHDRHTGSYFVNLGISSHVPGAVLRGDGLCEATP
jgi:hypothetical protein